MCFAKSLLFTHMQQTSRPPIVALLVGEELMVWIMPLMDERMSAHSPLRLYFASSNESVPGDRNTHLFIRHPCEQLPPTSLLFVDDIFRVNFQHQNVILRAAEMLYGPGQVQGVQLLLKSRRGSPLDVMHQTSDRGADAPAISTSRDPLLLLRSKCLRQSPGLLVFILVAVGDNGDGIAYHQALLARQSAPVSYSQ